LSVPVRRGVLSAWLAACLAGLVAACGSSGSDGSAALLADAAAKTRAAGSAKLSLTTSIDIEGGETISVSGEGAYARDRQASRLGYTLTGGPRPLEFELVLLEDVMYQRFPPAIAAKELPAGKPWVSYALDEFGLTFPANVLSRLVNDPTSLVFGVEGDAEVEKVGAEEVRGVRATHYRLTIDVPSEDEPSLDAEARARLEALREAGVVELFVEVWVDADELIRRTDVRYDNSDFEGGTADVETRVELYEFGTEVMVEPPPSDEVTTYAELVERARED
jgi:hypothetical protein